MTKCYEPLEPWHWIDERNTDCSGTGGDIGFSGGDLARGNALESAVLMQLFTDKGDGRGWWGSYAMPFEPGSKLWTLRSRGKVDKDVIIDAERFVRDALDPLIGQGLAASYEVDVENIAGSLSIDVTFYSASGAVEYSNNIPWVF